ncbi:hypothetical protein PVK06_034180 [Gossypium arboreum]|uniref:Uncharacterized protein n=1 Tax=Gossypium arboreum TaxID=29729 RepID=A0ABR0NDU3_GOSAR|nr:hypothetical protein PVK06_034180 [Gossypium arboreum]
MFKILSLKVKTTILGIQNRYIIHLNALELVKEYYEDLENATVQEGVPPTLVNSKRIVKTLLPVSLIGALTNHTKGIAFPFYSFYLIDGVVFFNNLCEAHSMEDVFEKVQRRALG